MSHSKDPEIFFNVISPRKPKRRGLTGLRVGVMKEEKVLPNLDVRNDGLATGCYNSTCSALLISRELCQPTLMGNVT